ncbi:MAG: biopolymer transporter ExbD [Burkholderiales bacterium]|nr:biopolymer transporter ExbD [Burkholderiales bacterium]GIK84722.1 MAG: biopolymer transporter ExbD [Betaproteobacteria bacterium]
MAMQVGSPDGDEEAISAINTTPLVDVMLVLLIIFLITIPVVTTSIQVQLPRERNEVRETKPENIQLSVDVAGAIYWNDLRLANTDALVERLKKIAVLTPQPEVHIRGDGRANYEGVGRIIYACQRAGIAKIGFITEPPPRS